MSQGLCSNGRDSDDSIFHTNGFIPSVTFVTHWQINEYKQFDISAAKHHIAEAPIDLIESLTEPLAGDMTLAECRAAWPQKRLWANINVSKFDLPPDQLKVEIRWSVEEGTPDGCGLALEISEDFPKNWQQGIPAILDSIGLNIDILFIPVILSRLNRAQKRSDESANMLCLL